MREMAGSQSAFATTSAPMPMGSPMVIAITGGSPRAAPVGLFGADAMERF